MFASNSLIEHIARGFIGVAALWYAILIATGRPWLSLALGGLALLAFRGCPVCWTVGLIETAAPTWRRFFSRRNDFRV